MTKRKLSVLTLTLIGAFTLAALAGILLAGTPSLTGVTGVEASDHESQLHSGESVSNQQAISDAIAAHGADKWHEAGFTGASVKVGIIDFGFQNLPTHDLSEDIGGQLCFEPRVIGSAPSAVYSEDLEVCQKSSPLTPPGHGTLSVEAVHLFAPDAEVYITNPTEPIQIPAAINWLIEQEVDVIIRTHGWSWEGAGDGKSFDGLTEHPFFINRVADIYSQLDKATEAGILWAQGMGNAANITWTGAFSDPDGDGWHNFSGTDECNDVDLKAYPQIFYPWLRWDDEVGNASAIRDLDIYLLNRRGDVDLQDLTQMSAAERAAFNNPSSSIPDLLSFQSNGAISGKIDQSQVPFPLEITTTFGVQNEGTYCLAVNNVSETKDARPDGPTWIQMQLWQAPEGENTVEYKTPELPSVITPADSANEGLIAVAGADPADPITLHPGSGHGPTRDGRIKPDIVVSEIDFAGGHIEAAAVAGALAALVKQRYPDYSPQEVSEYLKENAESRPIEDRFLGPNADPNNTWGHGFAILPDDVEGAMPPMMDTCLQTIDGSGTYTGRWDDTCLSENRPNDSTDGGRVGKNYYARFYTFTLDAAADVTVRLTSDSDPKVDTFLYLLDGRGKSRSIREKNDDIDSNNRDSRIEATSLAAGSYTIEATTYYAIEETTYYAARTGDFTLVVEIEEVDEPPTPDPGMRFTAISSGANHVCAIAEDGSIMCWGDDDYGQKSDRPTSGSFSQISSGDNHTCALRNDGTVICWGSVTVP